MPFYIISVGSNIDPEENIKRAFEQLKGVDPHINIATLLHTKPVGFTDQANFINTAFSFSILLNEIELKTYLKNIEAKLGRIRTNNKNGPRTIDLDIVKIDNNIVDDDYYKYDFVRKSVDELTYNQQPHNDSI
jgi:2-amino-4-hydroxy-6-hydroxymethyldihydropteridine diphosphokinase